MTWGVNSALAADSSRRLFCSAEMTHSMCSTALRWMTWPTAKELEL